MIGFTKSPNKIVMIVFFALVSFILLIYVDTQTNNYEPEEEILLIFINVGWIYLLLQP